MAARGRHLNLYFLLNTGKIVYGLNCLMGRSCNCSHHHRAGFVTFVCLPRAVRASQDEEGGPPWHHNLLSVFKQRKIEAQFYRDDHEIKSKQISKLFTKNFLKVWRNIYCTGKHGKTKAQKYFFVCLFCIKQTQKTAKEKIQAGEVDGHQDATVVGKKEKNPTWN